MNTVNHTWVPDHTKYRLIITGVGTSPILVYSVLKQIRGFYTLRESLEALKTLPCVVIESTQDVNYLHETKHKLESAGCYVQITDAIKY